MSKLRKSLYHLKDLPKKYQDILFNPIFSSLDIAYTEKTDGFAFEIGWDEDGFYCRSNTSEKMRNFGDFSAAAFERFKGDVNFDPKISQRLDLALFLIKSNSKLFHKLRDDKISFVGEMILVIDGKAFTPGQTEYEPQALGTMATFVIHTRRTENYHLSYDDLMKTQALSNDFVKIDHDVSTWYKSHIMLDMREFNKTFLESPDKALTDFETYLKRHVPIQSKWGFGRPEGFVFHHHDGFKFKLLTVTPEPVSYANTYLEPWPAVVGHIRFG